MTFETCWYSRVDSRVRHYWTILSHDILDIQEVACQSWSPSEIMNLTIEKEALRETDGALDSSASPLAIQHGLGTNRYPFWARLIHLFAGKRSDKSNLERQVPGLQARTKLSSRPHCVTAVSYTLPGDQHALWLSTSQKRDILLKWD